MRVWLLPENDLIRVNATWKATNPSIWDTPRISQDAKPVIPKQEPNKNALERSQVLSGNWMGDILEWNKEGKKVH
jgi:hypothetical protein